MYNQPPKTTTCQEKKLLKPKSAISAIISASPSPTRLTGGGGRIRAMVATARVICRRVREQMH